MSDEFARAISRLGANEQAIACDDFFNHSMGDFGGRSLGDVAGANANANASDDDDDDDDEGEDIRRARRSVVREGERYALDSFLDASANGLEASASPRLAGGESERGEPTRGRVAETPVEGDGTPRATAMVTNHDVDDGFDACADVARGSPGRVLRFSVGGARASDVGHRASDDGCGGDSRRVFAATFENAIPVAVIFGERTTHKGTTVGDVVTLGVVVEFLAEVDASRDAYERDDGVAAVDVLIFRVDTSCGSNGASAYVGECSIYASSTAGRRTSRRRSSLTTSERAPSANAVAVSPSGRFVFAPHATDGLRILRVNGVQGGGASTVRTKEGDEGRLKCGFRVVCVAVERCPTSYHVAVAGEGGRGFAWSWDIKPEDADDSFLSRSPGSGNALKDVVYRRVAPIPGAPTSLEFVAPPASPNEGLRVVVAVDGSIAGVWNLSTQALERASYFIGNDVRCVVPIYYDGLAENAPSGANADSMEIWGGETNATIPALVLAMKKPELAESFKSTEDAREEDERDTNVCSALIRSDGISLGLSIFPDVANACALASNGDFACVGARDGEFFAWDVRTGRVLLSVMLGDPDDDDEAPEITHAACLRNIVVASRGRRVECFILDPPALERRREAA